MALTVSQATAVDTIARHLLTGDTSHTDAIFALAILVPAAHKTLAAGTRPEQVQQWLADRHKRLTELAPLCAEHAVGGER